MNSSRLTRSRKKEKEYTDASSLLPSGSTFLAWNASKIGGG
jgi:hypothetical protein